MASKLIEQICSVRFPWEGRLYDVGASIGITALTATSRSTSELMSQADVACYAAKHAGRNRVSVYQFGH
ncbi:diguanylate cyclase domain-containing protein, partial [Klebsiella pneumoniae]